MLFGRGRAPSPAASEDKLLDELSRDGLNGSRLDVVDDIGIGGAGAEVACNEAGVGVAAPPIGVSSLAAPGADGSSSAGNRAAKSSPTPPLSAPTLAPRAGNEIDDGFCGLTGLRRCVALASALGICCWGCCAGGAVDIVS